MKNYFILIMILHFLDFCIYLRTTTNKNVTIYIVTVVVSLPIWISAYKYIF